MAQDKFYYEPSPDNYRDNSYRRLLRRSFHRSVRLSSFRET